MASRVITGGKGISPEDDWTLDEQYDTKETHDQTFKIERTFSYSKVDILIPFHGQYDKVTKLVESIYRTTRRPFKVTLIDDASPNIAFIESLAKKTNIQCIRNDKQVGFGASLKEGFDQTDFPWVVFLHSDCRIEDPNWLNKLGDSLVKVKNSGVKMISAVMDNPGEAEWIHPKMRSEFKDLRYDYTQTISRNENKGLRPPIVLGEDHVLPLICTLSHRDLYKNINGFIKPYPYACYEDVELAHRMRHYGFKQAICEDCFISHEGMATIKEVWKKKEASKEIMTENNFWQCTEDIKKLV